MYLNLHTVAKIVFIQMKYKIKSDIDLINLLSYLMFATKSSTSKIKSYKQPKKCTIQYLNYSLQLFAHFK